MNPARLSVTFPAVKPPSDLEPAIEVFHRCIQRGLVGGLILDVADYRHVPNGPGVLLVGHDVDYGIDRDAFSVVRKRRGDDTAAAQLQDALRLGLGAIEAVEHDGQLDVEVDRARFTVTVPDRRLGPPDEVAAELHAEIAPLVAELYGEAATVTPVAADDPRQPATVAVEGDPSVAAGVLDALGGSLAPGQSPWDISVEELARLRADDGEDFVLLDVREESEYETVNLGGTLIPLATLADRLDELDRGDKIVVHCRAGRRGATAVGQLREAGFDDAWNVNGALAAWRERIDPQLPPT
jgi:rhodanese-related sulfurtransferase